MVILEFRKEDHEENMNLVHRIKEDICQLYKNLEKAEMGERRYEIDAFDERGGSGNRGGGMGNRGGSGNRGGMGERRGGGRGRGMGNREEMMERGYPMYPMYPIDEFGGGRYDY